MSTRATIRVMNIDFKGNEVKLVDLYRHSDGYIRTGLGTALVDFFINQRTSNDMFVCDFITWYNNQYNEHARLEITDNAEYHSDTEYFYTVFPSQRIVTVNLSSQSNASIYCCHWSNRSVSHTLYDQRDADIGNYKDPTCATRIVEEQIKKINEVPLHFYNSTGGSVG